MSRDYDAEEDDVQHDLGRQVALLAVEAGHLCARLCGVAVVEEDEDEREEHCEEDRDGDEVGGQDALAGAAHEYLVEHVDGDVDRGEVVQVVHHHVQVVVPGPAVAVHRHRDAQQVVHHDVAELVAHVRVEYLDPHVCALQHVHVVEPVAHCQGLLFELFEALHHVGLLHRTHLVAHHHLAELEHEPEVLAQVQVVLYDLRALARNRQDDPLVGQRLRLVLVVPAPEVVRLELHRHRRLHLFCVFRDQVRYAVQADLYLAPAGPCVREVQVQLDVVLLFEAERLDGHGAVLLDVAREDVHSHAHVSEHAHAGVRVSHDRVLQSDDRFELQVRLRESRDVRELRFLLDGRLLRHEELLLHLQRLGLGELSGREDHGLERLRGVVGDDAFVVEVRVLEVQQFAHGLVASFNEERGALRVWVFHEDREPVSFWSREATGVVFVDQVVLDRDAPLVLRAV